MGTAGSGGERNGQQLLPQRAPGGEEAARIKDRQPDGAGGSTYAVAADGGVLPPLELEVLLGKHDRVVPRDAHASLLRLDLGVAR